MLDSPAKQIAELVRRYRAGERGDGLLGRLAQVSEDLIQSIPVDGSDNPTASLRRLESHIDNSPIAVTEWTPDGRILRWSEGAQRIFGWSREELETNRHLPGWGMMHADDGQRVGVLFKQLLSGQLSRFTAINRNYTKTGKIIWCQWFNSALLDEKRNVISVLSHAIDITERLEGEKQLREARDRLDFHINNSPIAITEWGPGFKWLRWSHGAERIFGYTEADMVGHSFLDQPFIHSGDSEKLRVQMELLLSGRLARFSAINRNVRKDGSVIWCEWHNSALMDAQGQVISVLSQAVDVTDRVFAESESRIARETLEAHLDNSPIAIVEWGPDNRFRRWTAGATRIYGYTAEEMIGTRFDEMNPPLIHPGDLEPAMKHVELLVSGRASSDSITVRNYRKDGSVVWMNWYGSSLYDDGQLVSVLSQGIDVSDRVSAEAKLRDSESQARAAFDLALVGMTQVDPATRRYVAVNEQFCKITGYSAEELQQMDPLQLTHPDDRERLELAAQRVLSGATNHYIDQRRCVRKDGKVIWIHVAATLLREHDGKPLRVISAAIDITDRVLAEQQLRSEKERAEAASRAKDRFIASLSHELRTPLTPARALLSVMRDDPRLPPDIRNDLQLVHRNVQTQSALIDDLLDVTRLVRGDFVVDPRPSDAHALIDQAIQNAGPTLEGQQIELKKEFGAKNRIVEVDPHRFGQVISNVLNNAMKFTPAGGTITVSTDNSDANTFRVAVTDSGIGISPENLARIFEPFERGEAEHRYEYSGLGLGLAIARSLLQRMSGSIYASSCGTGQGATFTITLPIAQADALTPRERPTPPPAAQKPLELRVLLVEDHAAAADVLSRLLRRAGCRVNAASNCEAAIELASNQTFDLILSDIGLPDGSGHDLLRRLRSSGVQVPAIALSGYGQVADIAASKSAGFAEHLTKPIDFDALRHSIDRLGIVAKK